MSKSHLSPADQWAGALKGEFQGGGTGPRAETAQSALIVILKLVTWWSIRILLTVFSTVGLQFRGQSVPTSLRPILGMVAAYVMDTAWSSCSSLLPPGGGFCICNTAPRIRSIVPEEGLNVLDLV